MNGDWLVVAEGARDDGTFFGYETFAWDDSCAANRCLSEMVHSNLVQIRDEHMRWAYETGNDKSSASGKFRTLARALEAGDLPSMWWTSLLYERHPKISPNLYSIYKLRALEMALLEEKPRSLRLEGGRARLAASLGQLCSAYNIPFTHGNYSNSHGSQGFVKFLYNLIPAPFRAILRFVHWWWTIRRHLPACEALPEIPHVGAKEKENLSATIVSYFPNIDLKAAAGGFFRSRYWESLHGALNREARKERPGGPHFVRWLFIRFPSPQLSFAQCRKLCRTFAEKGVDGLSFNYLEQFISLKDMAVALERWLKLCVVSCMLQKQMKTKARFKESRLDFWSWIKWDYAESFRGWRCLERCLHNRAFQAYFKMAGKQRWTLFPLENCPWERMLTFQARQIRGNGAVFGTQHSMVRPTDFRYFDDPRTFESADFAPLQPDIIGGNGSSAIGQWGQNNMPPSRMLQVEALRYLYLAGNIVEPVKRDYSEGDGEPLEPPAKKGHLLVLTSFFKDETAAHLELLEACLLKGVFDGWQISLKPHPVLSVQPWLERLQSEQRKRIMLLNTPLEVLLQSWQLVWASNSTTAALEAAIKGLPLMVMAPVNDFDLCPIQNVPGLARTASIDDVVKAMGMNPVPSLPKDYLDLNPDLTAFGKLLGLNNRNN